MPHLFSIFCESCEQHHVLGIEEYDPAQTYKYVCPATHLEMPFNPDEDSWFIADEAPGVILLHTSGDVGPIWMNESENFIS